MQTLLDAGRGIWIVCALTGIFSLPLLRRSRTPAGELAARALLIYTMAVPLAAAADLLNWATALCLCGASIAVTGRIAGPTVWLRSMATANPPQWRRTLTRRVRNLLVERRVHVTGSLALLSATAPFVQSVLNTRLPSEEYALLERTYLLMSGTGLNIRLPTSSLVALASIISAADPLQVVRFLKPILHVTCAVAVEALVRRATAQRSLAYLTAALTGFALVDVQSSVDLFALTMLLTGLAILVHPRRQRFNVTGACGVLTMCGTCNAASRDLRGIVGGRDYRPPAATCVGRAWYCPPGRSGRGAASLQWCDLLCMGFRRSRDGVGRPATLASPGQEPRLRETHRSGLPPCAHYSCSLPVERTRGVAGAVPRVGFIRPAGPGVEGIHVAQSLDACRHTIAANSGWPDGLRDGSAGVRYAISDSRRDAGLSVRSTRSHGCTSLSRSESPSRHSPVRRGRTQSWSGRCIAFRGCAQSSSVRLLTSAKRTGLRTLGSRFITKTRICEFTPSR